MSLEVVQAFVRRVEERAPIEQLAELMDDGIVQCEWPNKLFPRGAQSDKAAMLQATQRGRAAMASERYEIRGALVSGEEVALRVAWSGTLAVPYGALPVGHVMRAQIAMFFRVRAGRIVSIENYDCYD